MVCDEALLLEPAPLVPEESYRRTTGRFAPADLPSGRAALEVFVGTPFLKLLYWGYMGIMDNRMETTIIGLYWG